MNILPQITQITQRECSKLHYFAEKDRLMFVVFWCCLGFICVTLRDLRETSGVSFVQYCLRPLACYSPADYADYAEECSKLHYLAEKDRLFEVNAVVVVLWFVCVNLRDLRENRPFTHTKNYVDEYKEQQ